MAPEEITRHLGASTTRRTVVKTGAKLAYAAPILAASFKLSGRSALAVSGLDCGTPTRCGAPSFGSCPNNCFCASNADGGEDCVIGGVPAGGLVTCSSGAGCQPGQVCVTNTCFGSVCADRCAGPTAFAAAGAPLF